MIISCTLEATTIETFARVACYTVCNQTNKFNKIQWPSQTTQASIIINEHSLSEQETKTGASLNLHAIMSMNLVTSFQFLFYCYRPIE